MEIHSCLICTKLFKTYAYKIAKGNGKYCPRLCGDIGRKEKQIIITCKACEKKFPVRKSYISRRAYCSKECRSSASRIRQKEKLLMRQEKDKQYKEMVVIYGIN